MVQLDDDQNTVAGGYIYNGTLHLLDTQYNVYNISDQDVFVVSSEEETGLVTLYRVSDLETGELEQLGSAVSEALLYSDGSLAFIADADLQANEYNPVGSLYGTTRPPRPPRNGRTTRSPFWRQPPSRTAGTRMSVSLPPARCSPPTRSARPSIRDSCTTSTRRASLPARSPRTPRRWVRAA